MEDQYIESNGLRICYDEFGDASKPCILLIMGLGAQMIAWRETFCQKLAGQGFRVIRFDNRDIGLSEKIEQAPPGMMSLIGAGLLGLQLNTPYDLNDMAKDAVGVLDALDVHAAHIVGASMGGMIAQIVAAKYSDRVLSLTSIMSTTGAKHLPKASTKVNVLMLKRRAKNEEQRLKNSMALWRVIGSPAYQPSDEELTDRILSSYRRNFCPAGYLRQLGAITVSGDRVELLKTVNLPTLVIHGAADVLVPVEGGRHTAELVAGSRLRIYDGMGHDLPTELHDNIVSEIVEIASH
ncbi:MAG: alpha/beta fold hydrolase [Pseudomonadales bacterium]